MTRSTSPSPIIEIFVNEVRTIFPESERKKTALYEGAIAKTTSDADPHRARQCAKWTIKMTARTSPRHPTLARFKQRRQVWRGDGRALWFAMGDSMPGSGSWHIVGKSEPIEDIRIEWVRDAAGMAKKLGEQYGWENSPWEKLLTDLIAFDTA